MCVYSINREYSVNNFYVSLRDFSFSLVPHYIIIHYFILSYKSSSSAQLRVPLSFLGSATLVLRLHSSRSCTFPIRTHQQPSYRSQTYPTISVFLFSL